MNITTADVRAAIVIDQPEGDGCAGPVTKGCCSRDEAFRLSEVDEDMAAKNGVLAAVEDSDRGDQAGG